MLATPNETVEFSFDGKHREVSVVDSRRFEHLYSKPFKGSSHALDHGWHYAHFGGKPVSAYCGVAFDSHQTMLVNELRWSPDDAVLFGEGPAKLSMDKGGIHLKDKTPNLSRTLEWTGQGPDTKVHMEQTNVHGTVSFDYNFSRIHPDVSPYRCVVTSFGQVMGHLWMSPMQGTLRVDATGNLQALGLASAEPHLGKTLVSPFAYAEEVHFSVPFLAGGWTWNILACRPKGSAPDSKPEKFLGFVTFFVKPGKNKELPVNIQFYLIDYSTGKFEVYGDANYSIEQHDGQPIIHAKTLDDRIDLTVHPAQKLLTREFKGKRIGRFMTANVDFAEYITTATITIDGKKYDGTGTSELAGNRFAYWL